MSMYPRLCAGMLSLSLAVASTGCSSFHSETLATGAVGGAAAGAGTGAIIGALIANGDVAASALLGGAVGIPVGLAIAAAYDYNSEPSVRERNAIKLERNQRELYQRQKELDQLRNEITNDGMPNDAWHYEADYDYNGHTLGNYYR